MFHCFTEWAVLVLTRESTTGAGWTIKCETANMLTIKENISHKYNLFSKWMIRWSKFFTTLIQNQNIELKDGLCKLCNPLLVSLCSDHHFGHWSMICKKSPKEFIVEYKQKGYLSKMNQCYISVNDAI